MGDPILADLRSQALEFGAEETGFVFFIFVGPLVLVRKYVELDTVVFK